MSSSPLGKGLESLIPPNQQRKPDDAPPQPVYLPALPQLQQGGPSTPQTSSDAPIISASDAVKVFEQEPAVPSAAVLPQRSASPDVTSGEQVGVPPTGASGEKKHPKKANEAIYYIEVNKIRPNPDQPRKTFNEDGIRELASSIREFGILQPIVVSKVERDTDSGTEVEYELIAGERRLMATKMLGLETIPAIVRNMRLERERLEMAIVENIQRENLNPVEMARAYARLQDEFKLTQREVAARLGKSRETVANTLRLLDLPSPIRESIEKGQITESHGRLLLTIDDPALQEKLFKDLLSSKLTTRELKDHASNYVATKEAAKSARELSPEMKSAESRLASELGAPVAIRNHGGAGKITITFYSKEELENILRKLGGQEE